jgi:hypothetical protein
MEAHTQKDILLYRVIVAPLGLTVVVSILGAIGLAMTAKSIAEVLVALGLAAIGGLADFLVPSHLHR